MTNDLNVIKERFSKLKDCVTSEDIGEWVWTANQVPSLIAEVEALRDSAVKVGELYNERCEEVQALRAKLEKAKEALRSIESLVPTETFKTTCNVERVAKEALIELEKP